MLEIAIRTPPTIHMDRVIRPPVIECGKLVRLNGKLVVCIREAGHPVFINYAHTNGYDEWCFEAENNA